MTPVLLPSGLEGEASKSLGDWGSRMARPSILIVEDSPATCGVLQDLLEGEDYAVECATTGALALTRIERGGVDLVLLDLLLPDLTGLELCQEVRQQEGEVYLPI